MSAKPKEEALSNEAALALWAVAFDDDECAGSFLDVAVLRLASTWLDHPELCGSAARVERVRKLERELRIRCLRQEAELAERVTHYARAERFDEIPF